MTKINLNDIVPFEAVHVGEFIKDELEARNMSQSELARLTGIQKPILNDIIKGKRSLTPEMALLLESVWDIPARIFMDYQTNYDIDCARISQRVIRQKKNLEIWNVLKEHVNVPFFRKKGCIKGNVIEDVRNLFAVFKVESLDEFFAKEAEEHQLAVCYKKSDKVTTSPVDLFSWKSYCLHLSEQMGELDVPFDASKAADLAEILKNIFYENRDTVERVKEAFNSRGVKFLVIPKEGQVPVDGMSFWKGYNPTVVLTMRFHSIDNFAFAVLHELGHVVRHLKEGGLCMVNMDGHDKTSEEIEANEFAMNAIIPASEWKLFMQQARGVSSYKIKPYIKAFSEKLQVNPQLVFGMYKHEINNYRIPNSFETKIN